MTERKPQQTVIRDIILSFDPPPIPIRRFDWSAKRAGYDPEVKGDKVGWGSDPHEALTDLLEEEAGA